MATLLLWQFDKFLKKNRLAGYNRTLYVKVQKLKLITTKSNCFVLPNIQLPGALINETMLKA